MSEASSLFRGLQFDFKNVQFDLKTLQSGLKTVQFDVRRLYGWAEDIMVGSGRGTEPNIDLHASSPTAPFKFAEIFSDENGEA